MLLFGFQKHDARLRKKSPYSEFFWSVFSCIRTEYGEIRSIFPYSVRMQENTDQKNSENRYFLRSAIFLYLLSQASFMKTDHRFGWWNIGFEIGLLCNRDIGTQLSYKRIIILSPQFPSNRH